MPDLTPEQQAQLQEKLKNLPPEELAKLQKQQCIFCQIISGKIPSKKVYEDDLTIAIIDIYPASKGHLLLIPKEHYAIMPHVPEKVLTHLFHIAQKLSFTLLRTFKVGGTNIFVANGQAAGQRAPHFLIHVIPRREGDNLLPVEEKLIDKETQKKVKSVLQDPLNQILGVEHQVTLKERIPLAETQNDSTILSEENSSPQELSPLQPSSSERKSSKRSSLKPKAGSKSTAKNHPLSEEGVSLDDIANLFK